MALDQDKALAKMDILVVVLVIHMDNQIHSTRMDILVVLLVIHTNNQIHSTRMDILVVLLVIHTDNQMHSTRMDIEARRHLDLVEAIEQHHKWMAKAEDTLLLPRINMPTMDSVV